MKIGTSAIASRTVAAVAVAALGVTGYTGAAAAAHPDQSSTSSVRVSHTSAPTTAQLDRLFAQWNAALATGNAQTVAQLYTEDATLLPTLSPIVRVGREQIAEYFATDFLPKHPQGTITESHVHRLGPRDIERSGLYTFMVDGPNGTRTAVQARYTFIYEKTRDGWKILTQHSSLSPQK